MKNLFSIALHVILLKMFCLLTVSPVFRASNKAQTGVPPACVRVDSQSLVQKGCLLVEL